MSIGCSRVVFGVRGLGPLKLHLEDQWVVTACVRVFVSVVVRIYVT